MAGERLPGYYRDHWIRRSRKNQGPMSDLVQPTSGIELYSELALGPVRVAIYERAAQVRPGYMSRSSKAERAGHGQRVSQTQYVRREAVAQQVPGREPDTNRTWTTAPVRAPAMGSGAPG
jgi:hypothetical protein